MATRPSTYLYIRDALQATLAESEVGTGKTCRLRVCATSAGDPVAIGSSSASATATAGVYTLTVARATLVTDLAASYLGKTIYVHLDDGAAWHAVFPMVVTDVDPALMPALT